MVTRNGRRPPAKGKLLATLGGEFAELREAVRPAIYRELEDTRLFDVTTDDEGRAAVLYVQRDGDGAFGVLQLRRDSRRVAQHDVHVRWFVDGLET